MKNKTISIRLSEYTINQIKDLKAYYAGYYETEEESITTTEIVNWAIAIAHKIKCERK